jgi:mannan endo-1,4-beta-mannosidase
MKIKLIILFSVVLSVKNIYPQQVNFTVTVLDSLHPISPYIYGTNQLLQGGENWMARRQGGNRMTGYNWENNASNAGSDYNQSSDDYLVDVSGIKPDSANVPGIVTTTFHNQSIQLGTYSLVTLQMAGYVARDKNGAVGLSETAPSPRWRRVQFAKGSPLSLQPDTSDASVSMDEYVNFLVSKFGQANTATGIEGYSLDNEPALWPSTHPRIHPLPTTCKEIVQKAISLSQIVKNIDPYAEIFGPALYGFAAYTNFQSAPDWDSVSSGKTYSWFIDYYLDNMKIADQAAGKRLLNVLDLHWYPEAIGDHRITDADATTTTDKLARVQAPRTLWDKSYVENSWIGQFPQGHLPLIPKLMQSINKYYPGTKLSFSEFTYGGEDDISGGIAASDVLGIFAKYNVYFAAFWELGSPSAYVSAAYRMYRNYDGNSSAFGNSYIPCETSDSVNSSIYASLTTGKNEIHLIVINKSFTQSVTGNFTISPPYKIVSGTVWELNKFNSQIHQEDDVTGIVENSFSYPLPAATVIHFVLETSGLLDVPQSKTVPSMYGLKAYPNPFNPSCTIEYTIPENSIARIEIISLTGELVKSYKDLAHHGSLTWNATNDGGHKVASGVYFVALRNALETFSIQKLILAK